MTTTIIANLEKLLGETYNLVLFNGSNASKRAKEIFDEWSEAFPREAEAGAKSINLRKALVWKFKNLYFYKISHCSFAFTQNTPIRTINNCFL